MARKNSRAGMRRGELTPSEIARVAETADQGFTVRTTGPGVGKPARNVFSTGFAPAEGRGEEVTIDHSQPAADQLTSFNQQRLGVLGTPGASMAIGGWQDDAKAVQMDASVLTPKTVGGLEAALQMGTYGNQQAIGNLGRTAANPYIGDIDIPKHLHRGQFGGGNMDWHDSEDAEPSVQRISPKLIRITPSRKEMVQVEAHEMAREMGLPDI